MEETELTKSARGPPGCEELSARSSRFRAPETSGSKDERVTLKSTRQAVKVHIQNHSKHILRWGLTVVNDLGHAGPHLSNRSLSGDVERN